MARGRLNIQIAIVKCRDCGKPITSNVGTLAKETYAKYGQLCRSCAEKRGYSDYEITHEQGKELFSHA